jgi:SAM-dependent methyltransferase
VTRYLTRAIAGEVPTADEWDDHLIAFHRIYDDVTSSAISLFRTSGGETSYEFLARRVRELAPEARDILDVGCGDGTLLARIAHEYGNGVALYGVDLSPDEIDRARSRLPAASLRTLDAAKADLGQKSYDAIVSHLTFLIMSRPADVLTRVRDALRPRGILAFVTEDLSAQGSVLQFAGSVLASLRTRLPTFAPAIPRREPIERDEVLGALLDDVGLGDRTVERIELRASFSREQVWAFVERTYALGLLELSLRRELREHVDAMLGKISEKNATFSMILPLRLVAARARS